MPLASTPQPSSAADTAPRVAISLDQFRQFAPAASLETQAALFRRDLTLVPAMERILVDHGITEPHVVAQFLTACSLASDGFTNFDRPMFGLSLLDWLTARAREWQDASCNQMAAEWDWKVMFSMLDVKWNMEHRDWPEINEVLANVCSALGVADESEARALDRGASEM